MEVKIFNEYLNRQTTIVVTNQGRLFNFSTKTWDDIPNDGGKIHNDYYLSLPIEIFTKIAQQIKSMPNIPDKDKSFQEGKIEAMTQHLEDMRKLVFKNNEES